MECLFSSERSSTSPYTPCIGGVAPGLQIKGKIEVDFFHWLPLLEISSYNHPKASSLGRIVPTEAKPSELSGEILSLAKYRVKAKTSLL